MLKKIPMHPDAILKNPGAILKNPGAILKNPGAILKASKGSRKNLDQILTRS